MKNKLRMSAVVLAALLVTACSGQPASDGSVSDADPEETTAEGAGSNAEEPHSEEGGVLIAYFTRLDNTDAELDEIIRGGGPYGELGNSMEDADLDAVSSASITIYDGQVQGNTQTIAQMIQEQTGGDLFSIRTEEQYPADYDELIDIGGEEEAEDVRPELISHVENMEDYEIVFRASPTGGAICRWRYTVSWKNMISPGRRSSPLRLRREAVFPIRFPRFPICFLRQM